MILLVCFAFLAGAATAVSPCVLPVLPAVLSTGATGGRRRPLGIVVGLTVTFTAVIVGLAQLVEGAGLGTGTTRSVAILVLAAFGIALMVPRLRARAQAPFARLARLAPRSAGTGFWSGLGVGGALGFAYAPCAGPVLAAVVSVGAASGRSVTVGLSYAFGSAVGLGGLALLGRRVLARSGLRRRGNTVQVALGGVMALTALAMAFSVDVRVQTALATRLPAAVADPSRSFEALAAVRTRVRTELFGIQRFPLTPVVTTAGRPELLRLGGAPELAGTGRWFNLPPGGAQRLAGLRGRVVLLDFWTSTCINCIRTFGQLKAWDARYRRAGLAIVGVHTPEFPFERDAGTVAAAVRRNGLRYPVVQDNERATWKAWGNLYWPAQYLIDAEGEVRFAHAGEGDEEQIEAAIRALLAEAGSRELGEAAAPDPPRAARGITPETYLGAARAERFVPAPPRLGLRRYAAPAELARDAFALGGSWEVSEEAATAGEDATLDTTVRARGVHVVLAVPDGRPRRVEVLLDGRPLRRAQSGTDVRDGVLTVDAQRLYHLVDLPEVATHRITLRPEPGVAAYAFSFG